MADSSSYLLPLCERISHKSYLLRAIDLTILSLLFSLLSHRILRISQNDTVWIVALFCESVFTFVWLIITCIKWTPVEDKPYPNRLDERIHDLPSVDMFIPTADPVREPPLMIANTMLSMLSVNYPANKLACYVSDDGCSPLTYFSLKETSKFAKIWVPFCKKHNVRVRAPFRYFLKPLVGTNNSEFSKDWAMMKREYEKLCLKIEDAKEDSHLLDGDSDFEDFSNTKRNDHSTIVKVIWDNKGGVGEEGEVPHIVYISREKRPNYLHHYKTGAMNFLLRVSGLMTNAPYMLNVDCDMYVNEPNVLRQAMCVFLQNTKDHQNHCAFVQFPQEFYDSYTKEFSVAQSYLGRGVAGIQGPIYCGSGCFHTRRVMYGLSSDDLEDDGSLSSDATTMKYGSSKEMVKSVANALQRKPNPQNITLANFIEAAKQVGHCLYEYQTSWGKLGWLYDSVAEDINTSIGIHLRGWTSSYISPNPPAFLGSTPSVGLETIVQQQRWATGSIEVLFNKQSPFIGFFRRKIRFRQRLAYLWVLMCLRSIPELIYCLLPAYCLLNNFALYPKGLCLSITITLVGMHCLYTLWQTMSLGFSIKSWYVTQSHYRILATSSWLFSVCDIILKLFGISKVGFVIAKKTMPQTKLMNECGPSLGKDDGPNSDFGKFEFDSSSYFIPGTFIMLVNLAALVVVLVGLQRPSRGQLGSGSGLGEACGCILVVILFLPFLKGIFEHGKYGIPLSTLFKSAFLALLFVVFSMGK
ncbi:unnamed protein product [Cochlearia groenlandica]